ncbi:MAG: hypothetical protein BYD32DRAFT_268256 [Podila humilis]|nr:MAG: hypothetical protein BYD32DRAFT_268256 [Podila humilis]
MLTETPCSSCSPPPFSCVCVFLCDSICHDTFLHRNSAEGGSHQRVFYEYECWVRECKRLLQRSSIRYNPHYTVLQALPSHTTTFLFFHFFLPFLFLSFSNIQSIHYSNTTKTTLQPTACTDSPDFNPFDLQLTQFSLSLIFHFSFYFYFYF